jgi:CDP-diacylglycerol--serine O-phosphatidyltransferase
MHKKQLIRRRILFREKKRHFLKKGITVLPHLFTLGNVFFGFSSLIATAKGGFIEAAYCILIAALMDMLDGRIARFSGTSSEIGFQLDSLADAISFCIAPAFLAYMWQLERLGFVGFIAIFLYITCGLIRLARFNVIHSAVTHYITGLPSTVAGCFLSSLLLNFYMLPAKIESFFFLMFIILVIASLMTSTVIFHKLQFRLNPQKIRMNMAIGAVGFTILATLGLGALLFLIFLVYIGSSCYKDFVKRRHCL